MNTVTTKATNNVMVNDPFFNVNREPAFAEFNGVKVELNKHALMDETGNVLGLVSPNYNLVMNNEVSDFFNQAFEQYNVEKVVDHVSNNNQSWVREMIFADDQFTKEVAPGDNVKLKVKLWNGYNGRTSVGFALEGYRMVCTNGMMGWGNLFGTSIPHWGDNVIGVIKGAFENKFKNYSEVFDKVSGWSKKSFSFSDFEKFVDSKLKREEKVNGKTKKFGYLTEKNVKSVKDFYPVIMNQYNENDTVWGAYNVLTAIATHHTATKNTNSHLFTQGYKRMVKLTEDFVKEAA